MLLFNLIHTHVDGMCSKDANSCKESHKQALISKHGTARVATQGPCNWTARASMSSLP